MEKTIRSLLSIALSLIMCLTYVTSTSFVANANEMGGVEEHNEIDLSSYITSVDLSATIDGHEYSNISEIEEAQAQLEIGSVVTLKIKFGEILGLDLGDVLVYQLDDLFNVDEPITNPVMEGTQIVGEMTTHPGGKVTLELDGDYLEANGNALSGGELGIEVTIQHVPGKIGDVSVNFGGHVISIPVAEEEVPSVVSITKNVGDYNRETREIPYTITVEAPETNGAEVPNVFVYDEYTQGSNQVLQYKDFMLDDQSCTPQLSGDIEPTWNLGSMNPGDTKVLTYNVKLVAEDHLDYEILSQGLINTAVAYSGSPENILDEDNAQISINRDVSISKTAGDFRYIDTENCFEADYMITVTANSQDSVETLTNLVVDDEFITGANFINEFVDFSDSSNVTINSTTKSLAWNINSINRGETKTLTYTVKIDKDAIRPDDDGISSQEFSNKATVSQNAGGEKQALASASCVKVLEHEWATKTGTFVFTGPHAGQVKFELKFNAKADNEGMMFADRAVIFGDEITGDYVYVGNLSLTAYSDGDFKNKVNATPYEQDIDGDKSWEINVENNPDVPYGEYSYIITYYAKSLSGRWNEVYDNDFIGSVGKGGWEFRISSNSTKMIAQKDLNAYITKERIPGFAELPDVTPVPDLSKGIVGWITTIKCGVFEGTVFEDILRAPAESSYGRDNVFTEELIEHVEVKQGNTILEEGEDYTLTFDPTNNRVFSVTFNKAFPVSNASENITIKCYSLISSRPFDKSSKSVVTFLNDAKLHIAGVEATSQAGHPMNAVIKKECTDYDEAKRELTWRITINDETYETFLRDSFVVEDVMPADLSYVPGSARIVSNSNNARLGEVTTEALEEGSKVNLPLSNVPAYRKSASNNAQVILELKTVIDDPELGLVNDYNKKFKNQARITVGQCNFVSEVSKTIKSNLLEKTSIYNKDTHPLVDYTININPAARNLASGDQAVTLVDEMGQGMLLKPDSLALTNRAQGTEIDNLEYSWDSQTNILRMNIPNETPLSLTYSAYVVKPPQTEFEIANKAYIESIQEVEEEDRKPIKVFQASASLLGNVNFLLKKTDAKTGEALPNAEFEIYKLTCESPTADIDRNYVATLVTDEDGIAKSSGQSFTINPKGIYMYRESKAPSGYDADDTEHYFFYSLDALDEENNPNLAAALEREGLMDELQFYSSGSGYEYTVSNTPIEPAHVKLAAKKVLENATLADGLFQFELVPIGDMPMPEGEAVASNNASGLVEFGTITFDEPGTYNYKIKEIIGESAPEYYEYDNSEYEVTVTVVKGEDSVLRATVTGDGEAATFTNTYKPLGTSITLNAKKELAGRDLVAGEFTFKVVDENDATVATGSNDANGNITFTPISYTEIGEHEYTVSENSGTLKNVTYDETTFTYHVNVTDDDGQLVATKSANDAEAVFKNTFTKTPTTAEIKAKKVLVVPEGLEGPGSIEGEYTFTLEPVGDAPMPEVDSKTNPTATGGEVSFGPIEYTKTGTYQYKIKEEGSVAGVTNDAQSQKTVTVTVTGDYDLVASVVASSPGTSNPETTVFTNTYGVEPATAKITAVKKLERATLAQGMFKFQLTGLEDAPMPTTTASTATNGADGAIEFGSIKYNAPGTYKYEISEIAEDTEIYTFDDAVHEVTVEVSDNGEGALTATVTGDGEDATFTNTYNAGSNEVVINATKRVNGNEPSKNIFQFEITADDGGQLPSQTTVTNNGGSVAFGPIEYDVSIFDEQTGTTEPQAEASSQRSKIYKYTIKEKAGNAAGYTYDSHDEKVSVRVTDSGNGELEAQVSYDTDGAVFDNSYSADGEVEITAKKILEGRTLQDGEFTFGLYEGDDLIGEAVTNNAAGNIKLPIAYTYNANTNDLGEHIYTIREIVNDPKRGMDYDTELKTVKVLVSDNEDGTLDAKITEGNGQEFVNEYNPLPGEISLTVNKVLEGRALREGEFNFAIKSADGEILAAATNDELGNVIFSAIPITEVGSHVFTVLEIPGDDKTIIYDDREYEYKVLAEDVDGQIMAVLEDGTETATFTNIHDKQGDEELYNGDGDGQGGDREDPTHGPGTGDDSSLFLWISMLILSALGIGGAKLSTRRRQ